MLAEVRLYFTAPSRAWARASPSLVPRFFARCTRSTWSILLDWANSLAPLRALETVWYSLSRSSLAVDWEKSASAPGSTASSSARSTTDRVVSWPRHWSAQVSTKLSTICLPSSTVGREGFFPKAVSQPV